MDVFSRTFLPAAAEAGVALPTVSRHMPVLRRCAEADVPVLLVTSCTRPARPLQGEFLLVLTPRRLVITFESKVIRRLRLHLNTELRHLDNVTWTPDTRLSVVELAATAVDGIRERFWIRGTGLRHVWRVDALLSRAFRPRGGEPTGVGGLDGRPGPGIPGPVRLARSG